MVLKILGAYSALVFCGITTTCASKLQITKSECTCYKKKGNGQHSYFAQVIHLQTAGLVAP